MKQETKGKIIGYTVAVFLMGAVLCWYNHLLTRNHLAYWQWVILGIVIMWAQVSFKKILTPIMGLVFFSALTVQLLAWFGVMTVPLMH